MAIWDTIRKIPVPKAKPMTTMPTRDYGDIPNLKDDFTTVGEIVDSVNDTVKTVRNLGRRFMSLFDDEESKKLKKGDIIGICRGVYDHYGVYVNDGSVIHYSSLDSDTSSDNSIIDTSLEVFMRGDGTLFKLTFPDTYGEPGKVVTDRHGVMAPMEDHFKEWRKHRDYKLFSADETVNRALSRLGENRYSLAFNNCEHFAIWCKTGISESHQINALIKGQRDAIIY